MERWIKKYVSVILVILFSSCAYYNTFFNAKQNFNQGWEKQKKTKSEQLPSDVKKFYTTSIEKSWKLIDVYGDSSKYADDALLLIGKSHYQLEEYSKAERVFDQFLLKYGNSEFVPEARLWLGKTYIKLERDDDALALYNELFKDKVSKKLAAEAFYYLGELNHERKNYELAIENLQKCIEINPGEEIAGAAQYLIAQSFYRLEHYENAVANYDKVLKYDVPAIQHYQSMLEKVNAFVKLRNFEDAELTLKSMLRDQRFKDQYPLIETKLGNIYEFEGETDLAREYYESVVKNYPRTEGAALAFFYLGQLYEKIYGNMDSAKVKYEQVKKTFAKSEAAEDADYRTKLLSEYLKLRDQLKKDTEDMYRLSVGDSTLIDSVVTGQDTVETFTREAVPGDSIESDSITTKQRVVQQKKAISRSPEQVEVSLLKNRFGLAEYFLLKYQNYDSALVSYQSFINNHEDSLLTPKAFYALHYIYSDIKKDSLRAEAIKDTITSKYPKSIYARKLMGDLPDNTSRGVESSQDRSKELYLEAEEYMDGHNYERALYTLNQIAVSDSGSAWAQKARYAAAYIYEKLLKDTVKAIDSYTRLANEYPASEYAKIAKNKIKEPAAEPDSLEATDQTPQVTPDSISSQQIREAQPEEREERDEKIRQSGEERNDPDFDHDMLINDPGKKE